MASCCMLRAPFPSARESKIFYLPSSLPTCHQNLQHRVENREPESEGDENEEQHVRQPNGSVHLLRMGINISKVLVLVSVPVLVYT